MERQKKKRMKYSFILQSRTEASCRSRHFLNVDITCGGSGTTGCLKPWLKCIVFVIPVYGRERKILLVLVPPIGTVTFILNLFIELNLLFWFLLWHKLPLTWWFKTRAGYSLIILEARSLKSKCWQDFTPKGSRELFFSSSSFWWPQEFLGLWLASL